MTDNELKKLCIEEFSRIQDYMLLVDEGSEVYKKMYRRYVELKTILEGFAITLTALDIIGK